MNSKEVFEMFCKFEELTVDLDLLPTIIQDLIDALDLDQKEHTKEECFSIGMNAGRIYNTLMLIQRTLYRYKNDRDSLCEEFKKLQATESE